MSWVNDVLGIRKAEEEERFKIASRLSAYDDREEEDLPLHVRSCARRFAALVELQKAQFDNSQANKVLLLWVIALLVITRVMTLDGIIATIKGFL